MAPPARLILLLGSIVATLLFSAVTIVVLFIPYPSNTITYHLVESTSTPLPDGQYLTTALGYTYSPVPGVATVTNPDGSQQTYPYTSNSPVYYSTVYTAAVGYPYGFPQRSVITYVTTDTDQVFTRYPTATAVVTLGNGGVSTSTSYAEEYTGIATTYTTTVTSSVYPGYRRSHSEAASAPQPTSIPSRLPRQLGGDATSTSTTSATPLPSSTSAELDAITPGPVVIIWLLVCCVDFLFVAGYAGIYYFYKKRKMARQGENGQDGAAETEAIVPVEMQERSQAQQQTPGASGEPGAPAPAPETDTPSPSSSKPALTIRHARCSAACLFIFAILMVVPLGLMMYAAIHFNGDGNYDIGGLSSSSRFSSYTSEGCLPLDGTSPSLGYGGYYGSGSSYNGNDGRSCPAGQGMYEPNDDSNLSFSKYGVPVILALVFGWLLFLSAMTLGVVLCMHRGETRKERRARKAAESQRKIMMEAWTAGWQAQQQYGARERSGNDAVQPLYESQTQQQRQRQSAPWGNSSGRSVYGPLPATPDDPRPSQTQLAVPNDQFEDGDNDENSHEWAQRSRHRSTGGIAL